MHYWAFCMECARADRQAGAYAEARAWLKLARNVRLLRQYVRGE